MLYFTHTFLNIFFCTYIFVYYILHYFFILYFTQTIFDTIFHITLFSLHLTILFFISYFIHTLFNIYFIKSFLYKLPYPCSLLISELNEIPISSKIKENYKQNHFDFINLINLIWNKNTFLYTYIQGVSSKVYFFIVLLNTIKKKKSLFRLNESIVHQWKFKSFLIKHILL